MFILFFYFFSVIPTARPTTSDRPGICALFFLLTEGFRPLPSSCLFIASFQCSLRRFLFGKRLQRYCLYFKPPNFSRTFFQVSFSRTPRPRRSDALRHHAKASRPPVCFAFAVAKVLPFTFPAKLFRIFFCPFFQLFSQHIDSPSLISETFFTPFSFFCDRNKPQLFTHIIIYLRADIFL